jgi:glycerophosphoryl diester phosphodiesterase
VRRHLRSVLAPALAALCAAAAVAAVAAAGPGGGAEAGPGPRAADEPLVIGHRGASGYRPEHTLAAYELAARMGADYIEPDLVATRDGVLIARHEPEIGETTDVAERPEFASRRTTKVIDWVPLEGFFAEDFTLAEIKTLRARERLPLVRQENTIYDGRYEVPTLEEILDLRARLSRELRRPIGVYPETKHPTYHDSIGLSLEEPLVRALRRHGLDRANAPVFVQSFEVANLRELDGMTRAPLVQLLGGSGRPYDFEVAGDPRTYDDLATPEGLAAIATYADGIGPSKGRVVPVAADGTLGPPTPLVDEAHAAGLVVHPYTFRNENVFLPPALRSPGLPSDYGDALAEYAAFYAAGVDGLFSDNPDTAVEARSELGGGS